MITKDRINELLIYNGYSLFWKKNNKKAGTINGDGYIHIGIDHKYYKEHRLIYFLFNGYFPDVIDHKDGNKQNNSIDNLRSCTKSENSLNAKGKKHCKSGYKGVTYEKRYDTYVAGITINRKRKYIGSYKEPIRAAFAYNQYAEVYHKEFARLNIL
tara:strand:+ start:1346 stop:1813 length:468 start_codon:yes stop_codon:yes gene_type:complete